MARIPDDQIERLKSEVSLERLVTGFGVTEGASDPIPASVGDAGVLVQRKAVVK